MTFEEAALLPRSEKITLVTMDALQSTKLFDAYDVPNGIYSRDVDYFVHSVKENGADLSKVNSIAEMTVNETFCYLPKEKKLYVRNSGGFDPKLTDMSIVYRFFFSNAALNLPYDLDNGEVVEWLPYINSVGSIGQTLDDSNVGIVLESSSSIDLINQGFFDLIFDKLIWENKQVLIYSWFSNIPISEKRKIFDGVVESKDFSPVGVKFNLRDFVFKLRKKVNLGLFSEADGSVLDSILGTSKRRIYGRVDKCQAVGIDCIKEGIQITGTVTCLLGTNSVTGTGTLFLKELSPGDELVFVTGNDEDKYTIDTITSDTVLTFSKVTEISITARTANVSPINGYRYKNRRWHLAGHKLSDATQEITDVINSRQFVVADSSEFRADDVVTLNGITTQITRVSGDQIVLEQSISPIPMIGDEIVRVPALRAYHGNKRLTLNRDFNLVNTTEAIIELNDLAEFNISKERTTSFTLIFTNGSQSVTTGSVVDLRTILRPRDWIRKLTQSSDVWFEILSVEASSIKLRSNFTQASGTEIARIKPVDIIGDDSVITVDCYGLESDSSEWLYTASDIVKHLVTFDAGFNNINLPSFAQAKSDYRDVMSLVIPSIGSEPPMIRDVISMVNGSVFGSLYGNSIQDLCFSIVNTRRPVGLVSLKDEDILDWQSDSINNIISDVQVNYSHFTDTETGEDASKTELFSSSFVDRNVGIESTTEFSSHVYDQSSAIVVAQRTAFYRSLSTSRLIVKGKAIFFNYSVNDRIYLELERLYLRYGASTRKKIGIVSSVKKSQYESEIILNDMGGIFNRCPTIAPTTTLAFNSATDDDKVKFGFILDDETLTPDITSEDELGNCLIG